MTTDLQNEEWSAQLADFGRYLADIGYRDIFYSFPQMPYRYQEIDTFLARARSLLPRDLRIAVRLLALGEAVGISEVDQSGLGRLVPALLGTDIIERNSSARTYRVKGVKLVALDGLLLLISAPTHGKPLGAYFGDDSIKLTRHLIGESNQQALDCCCGSGIQSLYLASRGLYVTGVDIQELPVRLARLNSVINRLQDRLQFICGDIHQLDIYEPYDVVVSNPPLPPIPQEIPYDTVGDGGEYGWNVTESVLRRIALTPNPTTRGVIIGLCLGTAETPEVVPWLDRTAKNMGLSAAVFLGGRYPISALTEATALSSWFTSGGYLGNSMDDMMEMIWKRGAEYAYPFVLKVAKGSAAKGLTAVVPLYRQFKITGMWYVS